MLVTGRVNPSAKNNSTLLVIVTPTSRQVIITEYVHKDWRKSSELSGEARTNFADGFVGIGVSVYAAVQPNSSLERDGDAGRDRTFGKVGEDSACE